MHTHPHLSMELARDRQREMLAQAADHRRARHLRGLPEAPRRASRAERRQRRGGSAALRPQTDAHV